MCIDGIVVVSFKCIDLDPMLLVSSSAKSACLYRVICQIMYTNEMSFFLLPFKMPIHKEKRMVNRILSTHFHRHASIDGECLRFLFNRLCNAVPKWIYIYSYN